MGKQNRQRRAAKAKQRAAQARTSSSGGAAFWSAQQTQFSAADIANAIGAAARANMQGYPVAVKECVAELTSGTLPLRLVEQGVDLAGAEIVKRVFEYGWLPEDLYQVTRRKLDEFAVAYVVDRIAAFMRPYAPATVHPAWLDQVSELGADVWWSSEQPHMGQWAAKHILVTDEALTTVIETFSNLMTLPNQERILPLPGTVRANAPVAHHSVNEKMLSRVRALLAKAESSAFPEEAEALSAKAQELMTRHALDRVLVEADASIISIVSARRLWLETPYLDAKSLLVNVVASANRCRAIFHPAHGFVSILGDENDLDSVEILTTSLLLQATRAMIASGGHTSKTGQSRTRSFRQSFLVAYATRIGERLEHAAEATLEETHDAARLLPVLASQQKKVDQAFETMFPSTVGKRVSVSNEAGWGAGRAAADRAALSPRREEVEG
ncbi:MAG: hypothetical protein JWQ81_8208 [Amycolatopsis sp.]|jgi:hypothetical protein|uniref:DUF2786 domain-containing protein n=1 Tax=Amycolatopsis sp. TaxID=37632 RepID=UPI002613B831|nr:DUF2786 domain-containing protein [Amycolatopsis sp.]MCU1687469.1 hypothetical protein [Amycolatopsis sp.]